MLLTAAQAAEILRVSDQWIWKRCQDGTIPHVRLSERRIRIDSADVYKLKAERLRTARVAKRRDAVV